MWKSYFNWTTIETRKNSMLLIQMMPKRFWKHLTEYKISIFRKIYLSI
ncbi:DUF4130 domain-containing protein [Empedobacter sp. R132-2]|nr:DUF4130 domain-containing protein [Empedobacter sp. R132-2]